jgi:hypothetical protein
MSKQNLQELPGRRRLLGSKESGGNSGPTESKNRRTEHYLGPSGFNLLKEQDEKRYTKTVRWDWVKSWMLMGMEKIQNS